MRGVEYYNDSKATNVDATIKALESFPANIHLILGGKDKGSDYTVLNDLLQRAGEARVHHRRGGGQDRVADRSQKMAARRSSRPERWSLPSSARRRLPSPATSSCSLPPAPASTSSRTTSTGVKSSKKQYASFPPKLRRANLRPSAATNFCSVRLRFWKGLFRLAAVDQLQPIGLQDAVDLIARMHSPGPARSIFTYVCQCLRALRGCFIFSYASARL